MNATVSMYEGYFGNSRLWSVRELVSSVLLAIAKAYTWKQ